MDDQHLAATTSGPDRVGDRLRAAAGATTPRGPPTGASRRDTPEPGYVRRPDRDVGVLVATRRRTDPCRAAADDPPSNVGAVEQPRHILRGQGVPSSVQSLEGLLV